MTQIHNEFPNKEIWHTEGSSGTWIGRGDFRDNFTFGMRKSLEIVNNWSRSLIYWNIALNQNNGPIVFPNTANIGQGII
jgi:glucosylceramidase